MLNINLCPYRFNSASVEKGTCSNLKYYHGHPYKLYGAKLYPKYKIVVVADADNKLVHLFRIGKDSLIYIGSHSVIRDRREENSIEWFNSPTAFGNMSVPMAVLEEDDLDKFKCWTLDISETNDKYKCHGIAVRWSDIIQYEHHTKMDINSVFDAITDSCNDKYGYSVPKWLYGFAKYLRDNECLWLSEEE